MGPMNWIRSLTDPIGRRQGSPMVTPVMWLHAGTSLPRISWLAPQSPLGRQGQWTLLHRPLLVQSQTEVFDIISEALTWARPLSTL